MNGSVSRIISSAATSLRTVFGSKSAIAWMIVIPVVVSIFAGLLIAFADNEVMSLHVQDLDDSSLSNRLIQELGEEYWVVMVDRDADPEQVVGRDAVFLLVIPDGFEDWAWDSYPDDLGLVLHYDGGITMVNVRVQTNPSSIPVGMPQAYFDLGTIGTGGDSLYDTYYPTVLAAVLMQVVLGTIISMQYTVRVSNLSPLMWNTCLRRWEWLVSQVIWVMVPAAVCSVFATMIMSMFYPILFTPALIPPIMLSVVAAVPLAMLFSILSNSVYSSMAVATVATTIMALVSGGLIPNYLLNDILRFFGAILPMTYAITGMRSAMDVNTALSYGDSMLYLGLFFIAASALWVAADWLAGKVSVRRA